ncbi:MAG: hypothetical protein GY842_12200, partial [bacterium]|nr:hypothetical protein [bacterium]
MSPTLPVPSLDPAGTTIIGYSLLIDGNIVAGAPELVPGSTGTTFLDLGALTEGHHLISEQYQFDPGDQGLLASCAAATTLRIDRTAPQVAVTTPAAGATLCPESGTLDVELSASDNIDSPGDLEYFLLVDGIVVDTVTEPADSLSLDLVAVPPGEHQLAVMVRDQAGNAGCQSLSVVVPGIAGISHLQSSPQAFSPVNTTDRPILCEVSFMATQPGDYQLRIFDTGEGDLVSQSAGSAGEGETVSYRWDGRNPDGGLVGDGAYIARVTLQSPCGAS